MYDIQRLHTPTCLLEVKDSATVALQWLNLEIIKYYTAFDYLFNPNRVIGRKV